MSDIELEIAADMYWTGNDRPNDLTAEQRRLVTQLAWTFVPPQYRQWSVIAGGWATDPAKASDVDMWMLGSPDPQSVIDHLKKTKAYYVDRRGDCYGKNANQIIADVILPFNELKVQLLGTKATSIDELLSAFDISTHMHALTEDGRRINGSLSTDINEPGRITARQGDPATLQRAEKIGRRYCIDVE